MFSLLNQYQTCGARDPRENDKTTDISGPQQRRQYNTRSHDTMLRAFAFTQGCFGTDAGRRDALGYALLFRHERWCTLRTLGLEIVTNGTF